MRSTILSGIVMTALGPSTSENSEMRTKSGRDALFRGYHQHGFDVGWSSKLGCCAARVPAAPVSVSKVELGGAFSPLLIWSPAVLEPDSTLVDEDKTGELNSDTDPAPGVRW